MGALFIALTLVGYLGSAILAVAQLYDLKQAKWAELMAWLGFAAQSVWLVQRGWSIGNIPAGTLYDWIAFVVWIAVGLYLVLARRLGMTPVAAFLFPVVFALWAASQALSHRVTAELMPGAGPWLSVHLLLTTLAHVAFLMAAVFGIMYMEKERELRTKQVRLFYYQLPALDAMDTLTGRLIVAGWVLLTLALGAGSLGGHALTGTYWVWTPKVTVSLLIWGLYGFLVLTRVIGRWQGHRVAILSMVGFLAVVVNLFGVSLIFPTRW